MSSSCSRMLAESSTTSSSTVCGTSSGIPTELAHAWIEARASVSASSTDGPRSRTSLIESTTDSATIRRQDDRDAGDRDEREGSCGPTRQPREMVDEPRDDGVEQEGEQPSEEEHDRDLPEGRPHVADERDDEQRQRDRQQIQRHGDRAPLTLAEIESIDQSGVPWRDAAMIEVQPAATATSVRCRGPVMLLTAESLTQGIIDGIRHRGPEHPMRAARRRVAGRRGEPDGVARSVIRAPSRQALAGICYPSARFPVIVAAFWRAAPSSGSRSWPPSQPDPRRAD